VWLCGTLRVEIDGREVAATGQARCLRRALAPARIDGRERVQLVLPEPVWVDSEEATRAAPTEALALIGSGFLPCCQDDWTRERREQIEELRLRALEQVVGERGPARRTILATSKRRMECRDSSRARP
jgi:hypothetical protein